ncbi:MAG: glutamate 5-kinase [Actinobacteria bacterium]|nr:glutamate 5-kinase [Actinomycetota bacterium]
MVLVIKVGSNVATDERGCPRAEVLERIVAQAAGLHAEGADVVLVTSGAISRGMHLLGLDARPSAMAELQASSAVGQGRLYAEYGELFAAHGIKTAQVLLTLRDVLDRISYLNARRTLRKLLDWRVVPVINENDTTATDEIGFGDNDGLAALIAITLKADQLVLVSDVDALYTSDPKRDPENARPVRLVEKLAELDHLQIGESTTAIGSGGMASKVNAARMATDGGVPVAICSGYDDDALERAVKGDQAIGTHFLPHEDPLSSFKIWIRWGLKTQGHVLVDRPAAEALRARGASLLPVGIVGVHGEFAAGDAVEITGDDGTIAKGICNYGSDEIERIKGLQSERVRELMPHATDEAVHRNNLVLT